ncbi:MAG: hypothetical protein HY698_21235 [Deltaproteobacteria bacterium]|nr:hypothetical protein [Deltaproteobacteria bacterium]
MASARVTRGRAAKKSATKTKPAPKARASSPDRGISLPQGAAREALDRTTKELKKLQRDAAKNHWAIGRKLSQVVELGLHKARGFASVEEYAEKSLGIARTTTFQYMRVASAFSEEVAATFGAERLDRALAYISATPEDETPEDIPTLKIRIPQSGDQPAVEKDFAESSVSELRLAIAGARPARRKRGMSGDMPAEVVKSLEGAAKALDKALGKKYAKGADVVARNASGEILVDVRGVPFDRAGAAFRAVAVGLR